MSEKEDTKKPAPQVLKPKAVESGEKVGKTK